MGSVVFVVDMRSQSSETITIILLSLHVTIHGSTTKNVQVTSLSVCLSVCGVFYELLRSLCLSQSSIPVETAEESSVISALRVPCSSPPTPNQCGSATLAIYIY